jgi:Protein of unknown function (DUF2971)
MNDSKELTLAYDYALEELTRLARIDHPRFRADSISPNEWISSARLSIEQSYYSTRVFAASLSDSDNDLSQWRAYGGDAAGYSIGFPISCLEEVEKKNYSTLLPCIYDEVTQRAVISEAMQSSLTFALAQPHSAVIRDGYPRLIRTIAACGSVLKHEAFRVEREWRLVVLHDPPFLPNPPMGLPPISYRDSKYGVTPYVRLDLPPPSDPSMSKLSVRLGLGNSSEEGKLALTDYLGTLGYRVEPILSRIPLRK